MHMTKPQGPLSGITVIELGNYIAGPTAGRVFADFGATVIKVERPRTGDELRNWRLFAGDTSMLFHTINRNKRSIVLDLKHPDGQQAILRIAEKADVLIENFRPGTLEKWQIGPEELDKVNPRLVIARISAFGQTGPESAKPGFAAVAESVGGLRNLVGEPDSPPVRVGVSIGDSIAGIYAACGALMVLLQQQHAAGDAKQALPLDERVVDVALNESILSITESLVPDYSAFGIERQRVGGRVEGVAPTNAYPCKGGQTVVIAGNGDSIFHRYMQLIGRPDLAERSDLQTNAHRWQHKEELDEAITTWTLQHTREDALRQLDHVGVPAGPIYTAADIAQDAQYASRNMIQYFPVDVGEPEPKQVGFPGIVPVIGSRSRAIGHLAPHLGADTQAVLDEYGIMTDSEPQQDTPSRQGADA